MSVGRPQGRRSLHEESCFARRLGLLLILLCNAPAAAVTAHAQVTQQHTPQIQHSPVPMVAQRWSETIGTKPAGAPFHGNVIGRLPDYAAAKGQANSAAIELTPSQRGESQLARAI